MYNHNDTNTETDLTMAILQTNVMTFIVHYLSGYNDSYREFKLQNPSENSRIQYEINDVSVLGEKDSSTPEVLVMKMLNLMHDPLNMKNIFICASGKVPDKNQMELAPHIVDAFNRRFILFLIDFCMYSGNKTIWE